MDKIALITGANKGMGFEIARQLGKKGNHVLVGARNDERGTEALNKLTKEGINATFIKLDVGSESSIASAAQKIAAEFGKIDILINNAAINPEYPNGFLSIEQLPFEMLMEIYKTNVFGPLLMVKEFLPLLKKSDSGRIVNVSSTLGSLEDQTNPNSQYYPFNTLGYNTSKTALNSITVQMAKQLKGTKVKINSVCPGWVKTDMGSEEAPRTIQEGVAITIKMATIDENGPNGGFYNDAGEIPW